METITRNANSNPDNNTNKGSDRLQNQSASQSSFILEDLSARFGFGLWSVTFDLPGEKVNKFNKKVMEDFLNLLDQLEALGSEHRIEALLLCSGKPGNFIAGADIQLIQAVKTSAEAAQLASTGQTAFNRWEDLPFPTIAAVQGSCLGGGCELALASSAIVMSNDPSAKIGLPEVLLGIMPGFGGCVRLPAKVGIANALDLILTGKTLNGERAFKMGLADACLPKEDFLGSVYLWVKNNLKALKQGNLIGKKPKLGGMGGLAGAVLEGTPFGRAIIFKKARDGVLSRTRGHYPAPLEAIEVIQAVSPGYGKRLRGQDRDFALSREAQGLAKLAVTPVCKNLIRLFFLNEATKKATGLPTGVKVSSTVARSAGVLGAGVMGGGIAQLFADRGILTRMKDIQQAALATGIQSASKIFKKDLEKKKISKREYLQKLNLITPALDYNGFQSLDVVVEAVIEKMDIKKSVFKELENHISEHCVVASNTSSLSITEMQNVMKHPERFVGMHFFNPVHKMPLVEVIRGEKSSDYAVSTIFQLSKQIGKTPIVVKDAPGFLVNRLLLPYLNEAMYLLSDGATIFEIDQALLSFGMPMGPVELIDEVGVDVGEKVVHILHDAFGERMAPSPIDGKLVAASRLGKKNGKGFYDYSGPGGRKKIDESVYEILGVRSQPGKIKHEEIVNRCILPMINEAARCLDEQVVATASDVDLGMIMGTGFPPFRGGLLRYADDVGVGEIFDLLKDLHGRLGARFEPTEALKKRASHGQPFYND